jgi:hypothetical protein
MPIAIIGRAVTVSVRVFIIALFRSRNCDALSAAQSSPAFAESAAVSTPLRAVSVTLSMLDDADCAARSR